MIFLFALIGVAASDFFCKFTYTSTTQLRPMLLSRFHLILACSNDCLSGPNLNTISKKLHLSESMVNWHANNGREDSRVFSQLPYLHWLTTLSFTSTSFVPGRSYFPRVR